MRRQKKPFDDSEKRRDLRQRSHYKVRFHVPPQTEAISGITLNTSDSGMCLLSFEPINEGQKIIFKNSRHVPCKHATVVWVRKYLVHLCRAGLVFTK